MRRASPLAVLCVILICCPVWGATITVAPGGGDYSSIQDAVDRAMNGDTILVYGGTYREHILIPLSVILRAAGTGIPTIDPAGGGTGVTIKSPDVIIDGFHVTGCGASPGILVQSEGAFITGTTVTGCGDGIRLEGASDTTITLTTLTSNLENGITFIGADRNSVSRTTISGNGGGGVDIDEMSDRNQLYLNNFQNDRNAVVSSTTTEWSSPDPLRYEYGGTSAFALLGNYWSDYQGSDADRDGIGDTPYLITEKRRGNAPLKSLIQQAGKRDFHPLMERWEVLVPLTPVPTTTQPPLTTTITVTAPPTTAAIPTSMVTPTPPAEDTVPPRAGLPFLLFIPAALGAAYTVLRIWWHDQGEHTLRLSHLQGVVLGIMHTVSGGGLFILSYLFIGAALLQSATFGRYVLAVVVMGILILYISFSGFILAYSALKGKGALLLSRVHIIVAILPFSLSLIIITATQVKERLSLLAVTLLTAVSLIIAIWQYLNMIEGGNGGVGTSTAQGRVSSTDTITFLGAEPPHEEPGTVFPQELRERYSDPIYIGKGGIARVFRARRKEDGRSVAVKVPVSFDEATGRSFLKEMRIWEDLHHPNIVEITAVNILPIPFVEMAYYPRTLGEMEMPLPVEVALTIIKGISDGLRYAHEKGVIHRDLKPQNILLTDDLFPKISDWGLSRTLTHETAASLAGFSLPYAAPEQLSPRQFGDTDERTDIYQLGVIFYQVITGTLPFEGEGMYDLSSAIISNAPVPPAALKEELAVVSPIVMRCLEKEMKNRYQSVAELQQDLVPFFHS